MKLFSPLFNRLLLLCLASWVFGSLAPAGATTGYSIAGDQLYAVDLEGSHLRAIGGLPNLQIRALAANADGQLFAVAGGAGSYELLRIDRNDATTESLGSFALDNSLSPTDLAFDGSGRLWLIAESRLYRLSTIDGLVLDQRDLDLSGALLPLLVGLAARGDELFGFIYLAGQQASLVRVDPTTGGLTPLVTFDDPAGDASTSLAFEASGALWIQRLSGGSLAVPEFAMDYLRLTSSLAGPPEVTASFTNPPLGSNLRHLAIAPGPYDRGVLEVPTLGRLSLSILMLALATFALRRLALT